MMLNEQPLDRLQLRYIIRWIRERLLLLTTSHLIASSPSNPGPLATAQLYGI